MKRTGAKNARAAAVILAAAAAAVIFLGGCRPYSAEPPAGFAEVRGTDRGAYLALSPEGVRFRVRTVDNYPRMDTEFWAETLRNHLQDEGYSLISGPEAVGETVRLEWGVPYGGEDYLYTTAVKVSGRKIVLVETGARYDLYMKYADEIEKSISALDIR